MVTSKLAAKLRQSIPTLPPVVPVAEGTGKGASAPAPSTVSGSPAPDGVGAGGRPATSQRTTAVRPDVLKGREKIDSWLRGEAGVILGAAVSPKTVEQYKRNGARLHAAREQGKPVDLSKHEGSSATFYAYRAAVRWYAATHGIEAVREYSAAAKRGDEVAKADAWQRVLHFAADLVQYPKDAKPGLPSPVMVALGLDDAKPEGAPARAKREGRADTQKRETAKLKAANSIARKYPDWRALVWARLVAVKSPWLDHAAIAALTGARPDELRTAQVRRTATGIEIGITGAKVSDTKGQPWRLFALRDDGSDEYRHIAAMASKAWRPVGLPDGVTDYPDAFSAALARAGAQVLPGAERLSGYVYRHAFASDLKADGATKEQIAQALGHAVTKTQDAYGRAIGGKAGRRLLAVSAAREVRATHDTRYTNPTPAPTHADVHAAPAQPWADGFVVQDSPTWQSPGWEGPQ